ncbi:MAG: hypothetical protein ACOCW6_05465 [Spirochaetota bacterium]
MAHDLVGALELLTGHTEEIFLRLGDQLPTLIDEMRKSLEQSRHFSECLRASDEGCGEETRIGAILRETQQAIDAGSEKFLLLHRRDEKLFQNLDRQIERLSDLEGLIGNIREDSIEMELVSLNAMTVALKAGQAGRAFSYITEELKRLSTQTIALTEAITERGDRLLKDFYTFRSSVQEVKEFQEQLFENFQRRLEESFNEFNAGIVSIAGVLREISDNSAKLQPPLMRIMQEVQVQDIVKQSVDHVILSLREIHEDPQESSVEAHLDELSFYKLLPNLCSVLLDDIKEKIVSSLAVFREQTGKLKNHMEDVESQRRSFVSRVIEEDTGEGGNLSAIFDRSSSMLEQLLQDLGRSITMKRSITDHSARLLKEVRYLEEDFRSFTSLITRFHNIDVASRIEVAKQSVLQRMAGTVEEMTGLTRRIETDVNTSLDSTKEFIGSTSKTISEYQAVFVGEESFVESFQQEIQDKYQQLFSAKGELTDAVGGFSLFTERFLDLFRSTTVDLERLEQLLQDIQNIKGSLGELRLQAEDEIRQLLESKGLESWEIESQRLQELIERFTIFTHKQTAGELAGFEVEAGTDSGEVTLF